MGRGGPGEVGEESSKGRRGQPRQAAPEERALFDALPLASLVFDPAGAVLAANEAWTELSGLSPAASLGEGWLQAVPVGAREVLRAWLRRAIRTGEDGVVDCRVVRAGGERWGRWRWRAAAGGGLVVCVADIDDDKVREADLWDRATHDPLTGLVNRSQFLNLVRRALQRRGRASSPAAVVFVDLDGFKEVNDRGGHALGDEVLRAVGRRLSEAVRPEDVASRLGGDEFAVLCEDLHDGPAEAKRVARRLRRAARMSVIVDGTTLLVAATSGIAISKGADDSAAALLARADVAMYAAKRRRGRRHGQAPRTREVGEPGPGDSDLDLRDPDHPVVLEQDGRDDLAPEMVARLSAVGAVLESLEHQPDRLQQAVRELESVIHDVRAAVPPPTRGGGDAVAAPIAAALGALVEAERVLAARWSDAVVEAGDREEPGQMAERLARAALLTHAAVLALTAGRHR